MQSAKKLLRKEIKKKLTLLTEAEKTRQSDVIVKKLLQHDVYKTSSRISVYLHMKNEVRTHAVLEHALNTGKKVYIPKYVGNDMDMVELFSLSDYDELPETSWNIKQPPDDDCSRENAMETGGLDLIVVPGVGFTCNGKRLGHGRGYYDSYIEKLSKIKRPYLIGFSFNVQMCDNIPVSSNDKLLDEVLTSDCD